MTAREDVYVVVACTGGYEFFAFVLFFFFFSSRRRHTRFDCDWSSDVCSSDLAIRTSMKPFRCWSVSRSARLSASARRVTAASYPGLGSGLARLNSSARTPISSLLRLLAFILPSDCWPAGGRVVVPA